MSWTMPKQKLILNKKSAKVKKYQNQSEAKRGWKKIYPLSMILLK